MTAPGTRDQLAEIAHAADCGCEDFELHGSSDNGWTDQYGVIADALLAWLVVHDTETRRAALDLRPHESIALTIALAQMHRGDDVMENVATVCIFALGRLLGKVDYDADETTYRVYPPAGSVTE